MNFKLVNKGPDIYVLIFENGDEVMKGLMEFAEKENIHAAGVTAIGAFSSAEIGYFDMEKKDYLPIHITEQVEVLSLTGDIILYENKPKIHAHVVLGKRDGTAHGGHLLKAVACPTLEVIVTGLPAYLHREMDNATGIPLIKL